MCWWRPRYGHDRGTAVVLLIGVPGIIRAPLTSGFKVVHRFDLRHHETVSLADDLQAWSDAELGALLRLRPDLLEVACEGMGAVATRAVSARSIRRCLVSSDVGMLVILDALALAGPSTPDEIDDLLGVSNLTGVIDTLERLRLSALVRMADGVVWPVGPVDDVYPAPLGLGPSYRDLFDSISPEAIDRLAMVLKATGSSRRSVTVAAISRRLRTPDGIAAILAVAPPEAISVLNTLVSARTDIVQIPGYGTGPGLDPSWGAGEVDLDVGLVWLVNHGLLVPVGASLAVIPRELVIGMTPDGLAPDCVLSPGNPISVQGPEPATVAADAARAANRIVDIVEELLALARDDHVSTLKSGGVGVRELGRIGRLVGLDAGNTGRIVELAYHCGLVAVSGRKLAATSASEGWRIQPRHLRWLDLVRGWLGCPVFLSQALSRDERDRQRPALCDNPVIAASVACRLNVLDAVCEIGPGQSWDRYSVAMAAVWQAPNLWGRGEHLQEELVEWNLQELHLVGLAANDSPAPILRLITEANGSSRSAEIDSMANTMVGQDQDQLVIQADNTAVSLGPLKPSVASLLSAMADRSTETGSASYKFTAESLVGAFDAGWTAVEIEEFLDRHALSGIPQPLIYLINDVQRRYGQAKVLEARGVIVADDEAMAKRIAAAPEAKGLGLSLVAPTILVGQADCETLVRCLRKAGVLAVVQAGDEGAIDSELSPLERHDLSEARESAPTSRSLPMSRWPFRHRTKPGARLDMGSLPSLDEALEMVVVLRDDAPNNGAGRVDGSGSSLASLKSRLRRFQDRPVAVTHLDGPDLTTTYGVLLGAGDDVALLEVSGVRHLAVEQVVQVEGVST